MPMSRSWANGFPLGAFTPPACTFAAKALRSASGPVIACFNSGVGARSGLRSQ